MLAIFAGVIGFCADVQAQRARFDDFFQLQTTPPSAPPTFPAANPTIINSPPQFSAPPAVLQQPNVVFPSGPAVNQPNFAPPGMDPFQTSTQTFPVFPTQTAPQPVLPQPTFNPPSFGTGVSQPTFNQPIITQPNFGAPPAYNPPQFGSPQTPNQWPYQGTGSNWLPSIDWSGFEKMWGSFQKDFLPRVLERPRVRHTYLYGNNGNELGINDLELATTATVPNFLQSNQPLRISPGFIFHFWDGPDSAAHPGFDLPPQAYSAYLAFDHLTNPANQNGLETNFTVGYYSDFNNTSSDAFRFTGRVLGWTRLNPYTVGKFGIEYFDRVNVKLLPAFGVYMTPTPDMKFDLFFPRSKISHRIPNFSDYEAWVYVGGEYGGGSWAIERTGGMPDQADINDVRTFVGLEWMGPRRITGFIEVGYVFEREIVYRSDRMNNLDLQDTMMIRSGLAF